jgi:hypothetical protein
MFKEKQVEMQFFSFPYFFAPLILSCFGAFSSQPLDDMSDYLTAVSFYCPLIGFCFVGVEQPNFMQNFYFSSLLISFFHLDS